MKMMTVVGSHTLCRAVSFTALLALFIVQRVNYPLKTDWIAIGEYFHCGSYILFVDLVVINRGLKGLSVKTQLCFLFVHWFRYIDSFFETHRNTWVLVLKIFYLAASTLTVLCIIAYRDTYEKQKDTCSLLFIFISSIIFSIINFIVNIPFSNSDIIKSVMQYFWTLSHYLQGFAMLPQFIFCFRDIDNNSKTLTAYVLMLSAYRLAYGFNWLVRGINEGFFYISGPLGLLILIIFLADFIFFKCVNRSIISSIVLRIDDRVEQFQQPLLRHLYSEDNTNFTRLPITSPTIINVSTAIPSARRIQMVELTVNQENNQVDISDRIKTDNNEYENDISMNNKFLPSSSSSDATSSFSSKLSKIRMNGGLNNSKPIKLKYDIISNNNDIIIDNDNTIEKINNDNKHNETKTNY